MVVLQAAAPSKRKKVEEDLGPPITLNEPKEKRFKDEKNMKVHTLGYHRSLWGVAIEYLNVKV